ncbi:Peptidase S16 [Streptococcus agalactiae]|nr:Peptidase S16 [Streptococcus agalactiae]AHN30072.1 peptidase S16 [Streptococcus agalactiae 138P]AHX74614.1 peptidase S16 [Streptococcus agalactiae]AKU01392.1 peptidase S16 [Streptococcus agalactiae]ANI26923.1 peptidase S16 [Streptococcus agalactiae]
MKNKDPKRKHKSLLGLLKWWIIGFAFLLLVLASLVVRLPYYLEMPGGAYDIRSVLKVNKKADKAKGSYNFVAVSVSQATPAQVLYAWLTPFTELSSKEETTGGFSNDDYLRINQFYMETSQLIKYVAALHLGDKVKVQYTSQGKKKESVGKVIKLSNGKNGIGIGLTDHTEVSSDVPVDFNTEGVGGPSAGLMFTLAIYDQLVKEDLRKGRKIAGTGTIEQNGHVGDIGGAGLKVVSAAKKGMDIFFVPNNPIDKNAKKGKTKVQTNYQEAKAAAKRLGTKMKIVPVQNVQQAIDYLKKTK